MKRAELTVEQLWLRYLGIGGEAGFLEVDAYVHGLGSLPPLQRDILAQAINERLDELTWTHRAVYSRPVRDAEPRGDAFAALVRLLEGTELAPPDRLPSVAEAAGKALGVRITIYLVDYEQQCLQPLRHPDTGDKDSALDVDTTLAGRAFQQARIQPSATSAGPRLWVPLLDGAERLGVLEVAVDSVDDLHDPGLRVQCRWLSHLLGHMVTLLSQYGDVFDRTRLRTQRTVNAELIWSLLPPLTAGVDGFVVTGVLEPGHTVSGDAFDYALSESTATLIVLDSVGRDLRSGLVAAAALAAHRSARHAGHGLHEQARLIDQTIGRQFGDAVSVTAVLAELDLASGRLRYINAGHPDPLIMRAGEVVEPLGAGRCRPLGSGVGDIEVGAQTLRPEDLLVLCTDGITEARDEAGDPFGEARLTDFLRRETAVAHPLPEIARRLINAVIAHQNETPRDDATILLARWTRPSRPTGAT
ncbi:PP2C family protein-serine/threonine phosphatase [Kibdelosporangium persicum]